METKKSSKADLENKKAYFTSFGLIFSLTAMLIIFGWKTYDVAEIVVPKRTTVDSSIIDLPPIKIKLPEPPKKINTTVINLVDNKTKGTPDLKIDAGIDDTTKVQIYVPVKVEVPDEKKEEEVILVPDVAPAFPGGLTALYKYIYSKVKYTDLARDANISGTVTASFVVEKDGTITAITLLRGVGGGLDEQVLQALAEMPKWSPGWKNSKLVRVSFVLPVKFRLEEM